MRTGCDVRACSAPSTGCPGIAVPPGSAHLPLGRLKPVRNQCESGRAIRLGATTLPALKDLLKIRYALTRYRTRHAIIVRNTLPGGTFTWRNVYLEKRLPGGTSTWRNVYLEERRLYIDIYMEQLARPYTEFQQTCSTRFIYYLLYLLNKHISCAIQLAKIYDPAQEKLQNVNLAGARTKNTL